MIVTRTIDVSKPLSKSQIKMLDKIGDRPIVYDEDCPEFPEEVLRQFKPVSEERKKYLRSIGQK